MEALLREFKSIGKFAVGKVEKMHPKLDNIVKLTLDFESKTQNVQLILIEPFPPLGRANKDLERLKSLRPGEIDRICAFGEVADQHCPKNHRIEIWMNSADDEITVFCRKAEISVHQIQSAQT